MTQTSSYRAGVEAANDGTHIDNSYPWVHEEWVQGYRSVKPNAQETTWLKELFTKSFPEEYDDNNPLTVQRRRDLEK